ncbi:acetyl-CoA carboxylase [Reinekea sp. MED297]|uniref:Acetyl-CoA carboxylase n=2 Tax=Reinekea TaxID=230494 RepID=A4BF10_9GAMM|nr:acetyl-CoA carboxylase [Reinekea sp. MED297] [Reinekea blandensis MED297]
MSGRKPITIDGYGSDESHEEWFYPKQEQVITLDDAQVNYRVKADNTSESRTIDLRS